MYTKMGGRTRSAIPLQMRTDAYTIEEYIGVEIFAVGIFGLIFYLHNVVGDDIYSAHTNMGGDI